jgi:hypothetical protein
MAKSIDTPIFLCYNELRGKSKMSIKIALLKSGESVIADIKELVREDNICGYLFKNPYAVNLLPKYGFLTEESAMDDGGEDDELNVSFTPWIPLTMDKEIPVRYDWLVTVVSPAKEIEKLYEEMINGQDNQTDSTDEQ